MTAREFAETWSLPSDQTLNDAMYVFAEDYAQWVRMRVQVLYVTLEKAWEIDPHSDKFIDALNALREFVELPSRCSDCIPSEGEEHHKACPKGWGRLSDTPAQGSELRPGVGGAVESNTVDEKGLASRVEELERELAKRFDAHEWEGYRDVAICLVLGYCGFQQCQCDLPNIWERNGDKAYEMAVRALAGKKEK